MSNNDDTDSIKVNISNFMNVVYPDFLYTIQNKFREYGVKFIDLNTGLIVEGNVNIDTLGMITKKSFKKTKKTKGNTSHYLIQPNKKRVYDVEATINIFQPTNDDNPDIITIQVVNQNDLKLWQDICLDIIRDYLYPEPNGRVKSKLIFHLIPLALPSRSNPQSAIQTMLDNIQNYQSKQLDFDMIPGYAIPAIDIFDEDLDQ